MYLPGKKTGGASIREDAPIRINTVCTLFFQTRILVTHGLTHLPDCDKIIVMHDGQIIESGTYNELIMLDGKLAEMVKSQESSSSEGTFLINHADGLSINFIKLLATQWQTLYTSHDKKD